MAGTPDVLLVSLGGTAGLREADDLLAGSLRRAGAAVEVVRVPKPREWRTMAAIELAWALNARRATRRALEGAGARPGAVLYSTTTAALLAPVPGAIRFDAPAAGNRPGRHGVWQRPAERARFSRAQLLVPWSAGAVAEAPAHPSAEVVVVPPPVAPSGPPPAWEQRDITAVAYGANPEKKGLDRVLAAWSRARRDGEELVVGGLEGPPGPGVRYTGLVSRDEYRSLLRRARVFVTAPRREDFGIAQLEALADGAQLVTNAAPGPYAALPLARALDPRLVTGSHPDALAHALRLALDWPSDAYADRSTQMVAERFSPRSVDAVVADELVPRLLR